MGYTYYQIAYLIPSDVDYTFDGLVEAIRGRFPSANGVHIDPEKRKIVVSTLFPTMFDLDEDEELPTWSYYLVWNDAPSVVEESVEQADQFSEDDPNRARVESSRQRIEGHGDPDPDMRAGFELFVTIDETLEEWLKGCYRLDSYSGKLTEAGNWTG